MTGRRPAATVLTAFAAEVFGMAAIVSFPALMPLLVPLWGLSETASGWISGIYFAGYAAAAPLFGMLGDRWSARGVFLWSMAGSVATTLAFALLADGAWSAGALRFAQGIAFAGIHMPGMKALTEAVPDGWHERAAAAFTATFPVGAGLSFLLTGALTEWLGWREAMLLLAAGPVVGCAVGWIALPPAPHREAAPRVRGGLLDVLRLPGVIAHVLAYFLHNGEASVMRSWTVAFLAFATTAAAGGAGEALSLADLALVATVANLLGLPGIALGVGLTRWLPRTITIALIMPTSAAVGIGLGLSAGAPIWVGIGLALLYGFSAPADSGLINAGLVARVPAAYRGRMLALQGMSGMSGGFVLPIAFGVVLGSFGGAGSADAWVAAYVAQAAFLLLGPVILLTLARGR